MTAARNAVDHVPHAAARAYERYGLQINWRDLGLICGMVQRNEATLDRRNDNGTTQWFLTYNGVPVRVIISADFHRVVTFLPLVDKLSDRQVERKRTKRLRKKKLYHAGKPFYAVPS